MSFFDSCKICQKVYFLLKFYEIEYNGFKVAVKIQRFLKYFKQYHFVQQLKHQH